MKPKKPQSNIATKIKKWVQTAKEAEKTLFAISITRLTSIKTLCADRIAAEKFAFYIAQRIQYHMSQATCPEDYPQEEWEQHKQVVGEAIATALNRGERATVGGYLRVRLDLKRTFVSYIFVSYIFVGFSGYIMPKF